MAAAERERVREPGHSLLGGGLSLFLSLSRRGSVPLPTGVQLCCVRAAPRWRTLLLAARASVAAAAAARLAATPAAVCCSRGGRIGVQYNTPHGILYIHVGSLKGRIFSLRLIKYIIQEVHRTTQPRVRGIGVCIYILSSIRKTTQCGRAIQV